MYFNFFSVIWSEHLTVFGTEVHLQLLVQTNDKSKYLYKLNPAVAALVQFLQLLTEHAAMITNTTYNIILSPNFLEGRLCS